MQELPPGMRMDKKKQSNFHTSGAVREEEMGSSGWELTVVTLDYSECLISESG